MSDIINDGPVIAVTPHGDGTGTQVTYEAGEVVANETIDVETPEAPPPDLLDILDRAEQARDAAYAAVMAGGLRTMARLEDADRAGTAAAQAVLNSRGTP